MNPFDCLRPQKLEGHGILQVSAARSLLAARGTELSRSKRVKAEDLLEHTEDLRQVLQEKHLLARTKLARQYDRKAVEALHTIQGMLVPRLGSLSRPTRS